jgi:hypothetical protein
MEQATNRWIDALKILPLKLPKPRGLLDVIAAQEAGMRWRWKGRGEMAGLCFAEKGVEHSMRVWMSRCIRLARCERAPVERGTVEEERHRWGTLPRWKRGCGDVRRARRHTRPSVMSRHREKDWTMWRATERASDEIVILTSGKLH